MVAERRLNKVFPPFYTGNTMLFVRITVGLVAKSTVYPPLLGGLKV